MKRNAIFVKFGSVYVRKNSLLEILRALLKFQTVLYKPRYAGCEDTFIIHVYRVKDRFLSVLLTLISIFRHITNNTNRLLLPDVGTLAIPLRAGGCKIFDFQRGIVTAYGIHIQSVRGWVLASKYNPTMLRVIENDLVFCEQIVTGKRPHGVEPFYKAISLMLQLSPAKRICSSTYVDSLFKGLRRKRQILGRGYEKIFDSICLSIRHLYSEVRHCQPEHIVLVLSHGDINSNNLIISKSGGPLGLIDWETASMRSIGFEVYSLHLQKLSRQSIPRKKICTSIKKHFLLLSEYGESAFFLDNFLDLSDTKFGRFIFYMEYVNLKLKVASQDNPENQSRRIVSISERLQKFLELESFYSDINYLGP